VSGTVRFLNHPGGLMSTSEMSAVHDCLRHEFGRLPIMVKATAEGDADRAAIVGGHVLLMTDLLDAHHAAEDSFLLPTLLERAPDAVVAIDSVSAEHAALSSTVHRAREQAAAFIASPGNQERAGLHTTLIGLEKSLLHHLAVEDQQLLPVIEASLEAVDYARFSALTSQALTAEETPIVLGFILDDTSRDRSDAVLAQVPADHVAAYEATGRAIFQEYKARLTAF
jgi:iron-sulfur cluster repair protein YtfE (RIC family)